MVPEMVDFQGHGCKRGSYRRSDFTFRGCEHHNQGVQTSAVPGRGASKSRLDSLIVSLGAIRPYPSHALCGRPHGSYPLGCVHHSVADNPLDSTASGFDQTCITVRFLVKLRQRTGLTPTQTRFGLGQMKYSRQTRRRCGSLGVIPVRD